jgi:hypothetical protein
MLTGMMFAKDVEVMRRFYAEGSASWRTPTPPPTASSC